ncbi:FtsK/SpoIIIE domain-containing protein, partial [Nocardiopsis tropica]
MVHDTTPRRRHLRVVGDTEHTDGVDLGVTYEAPEPAPAPAKKRVEAEPLEGRLVQPDETTGALTPKRAALEGVNARLKAALEAGNTYALLAWARRWHVAMGYVMDPALREELIDAAERDLDRKRATAAKKLRFASPEERAAAQKEVDRLNKRIVSEFDADARLLAARTKRLLHKLVVPGAVVVGPVLLAASGVWVGLLAWPTAWVWLAVQGRAFAHAELGAAPAATELEEKARHLATASAAAPGTLVGTPAPAGQTGVRVVGADTAENAILARLEPAYWEEHAKDRGLEGLVPGAPAIGPTGIAVPVALHRKWTPAKVRAHADVLRAMLAVPEGTGMQVMPGEHGDGVVVRIRTRTPGTDMTWSPDRAGIGVVPETGRVIELDAYGHRVVAGVTGSGKSTAMRPWMASVVLNPLAALVFVDPKGQEAPLWEHCARTVKGVGAEGRARMYATISEVVEELVWRQENAEGTDWEPTEDHPELVLVVDEGANLVRMSKEKQFKDVLDLVEKIACEGRAAKVWLHWATQYPTKEDGIPAQVVENILNRLALSTGGPQADRVVFGEQATATGWAPSDLPIPGWSMLRTPGRDASPEHIQMVFMSDEQVLAL